MILITGTNEGNSLLNFPLFTRWIMNYVAVDVAEMDITQYWNGWKVFAEVVIQLWSIIVQLILLLMPRGEDREKNWIFPLST